MTKISLKQLKTNESILIQRSENRSMQREVSNKTNYEMKGNEIGNGSP
jgi:hypothetical protein